MGFQGLEMDMRGSRDRERVRERKTGRQGCDTIQPCRFFFIGPFFCLRIGLHHLDIREQVNQYNYRLPENYSNKLLLGCYAVHIWNEYS